MRGRDHGPETVATVSKNAREQYHVSRLVHDGRTEIEVRVFRRNGDGEMKPTPRAIHIRPENLAALIEGMLTAGSER